MNHAPEGDRVVVSRGEIESLCMLHAIPADGCRVADFPNLLGLSPLLAEAVAEAIVPMVNSGWIQEQDERVEVTTAGRAWLKERLAEIGVRGGQSEP